MDETPAENELTSWHKVYSTKPNAWSVCQKMHTKAKTIALKNVKLLMTKQKQKAAELKSPQI